MSDAISRRAFAEQLALAAAVPFFLDDLDVPSSLSTSWRGGQGVRPTPWSGGQGERSQQGDPSPLAKSLAEAIRLRYPDRFSADELAVITRSIDNRLRQVERLYETTLTNADEPDFVYSVYRGPDL
ncbi:MAG: hypothetical protein ACREMN_08455 [Gemmatimonadales bacterium]